MDDYNFEVKQSRNVFIIEIISTFMFEMLFLTFAIIFLVNICKDRFNTYHEISLYGISMIICWLYAIIILIS